MIFLLVGGKTHCALIAASAAMSASGRPEEAIYTRTNVKDT
jgi:hypothetical protein